jgi:hypothetical protein
MKKRPLKIVGLEDCLAKLPEKDRASVQADISKILEDPDEAMRGAQEVDELPPGTKDCPACAGPLTPMKDNAPVVHEGKAFVFVGCRRCDRIFLVEAPS